MKKIKLSSLFLLLASTGILAQTNSPWNRNGNSITNGDWLGTSNNEALLLKANNNLGIKIKPNGELVFKSLDLNSDNGPNGIVFTDGQGKIFRLNFSGNSNDYLLGNGTWAPLPTSATSWQFVSNNLFTNISGSVGIGTSNPQYKLDVVGDAKISNNLYVGGAIITTGTVNGTGEVNGGNINVASNLNVAGNITFSSLSSGGTKFRPLYVSPSGGIYGDLLGDPAWIDPAQGANSCNPFSDPWRIGGNTITGSGYVDFSAGTCDNYDFVLKSNNNPKIWLKNTANNEFIGFGTPTPTQKFHFSGGNMRIDNNVGIGMGNIAPAKALTVYGQVQVGTKASTSHPNAEFMVFGTAVCTEMYVTKPALWFDHVFKPDYKLLPLAEVEEFYKKENHLPDVPSEAQLKEKDINVAEMDAILLRKIEELTLYTVELNKELKAVKEELKTLKSK